METIDRFLPSNVWWGFLFIGWDGRWACIFLYIYWWRMVLPEISCPSQDCRRLVQLFPGRGSGSLTRPEKRRRIYRLPRWVQQCQALWSPKEPCQHAYRVNRLLTNFIYIYILGIMRKLCLCGGANINILGSRSKYIFRCKQGKPFFFFRLWKKNDRSILFFFARAFAFSERYETAILFGSCSGFDFGNCTVSTPCSKRACISSG